jgi:hypothetical protein
LSELSLRLTNWWPDNFLIVWSVNRQQLDIFNYLSWVKDINMLDKPLSVTELELIFREVILLNRDILWISISLMIKSYLYGCDFN